MSTAGDNMASDQGSATGNPRAPAQPSTSTRVPLDPSRVPEALKNVAHLFSTDVDRIAEEETFDPTTASPDSLNDYIFVVLTERLTLQEAKMLGDWPRVARENAAHEFEDWSPEHFRAIDKTLRRHLRTRLALFDFSFPANSGTTWDQ
ncbi:hypothetical protein SEPCBS119000_006780, partial [Sporothrix epigloea]